MAAGQMGEMAAAAAGVPVMDAFLPYKQTVPAIQAQPIDGVWTISTIAKRIRIEGGRAYALDPWLHGLSLRVRPDMVVTQNIRPTGPGTFEAEDLPLSGPSVMQVQTGGVLAVNVKGMLGPASFVLRPVELNDPNAYAAFMEEAGVTPITLAGGSPGAGYTPVSDNTPDNEPDDNAPGNESDDNDEWNFDDQ